MKLTALAQQGVERRESDPRKLKLRESCEEFEAILTTTLFKAMRETVHGEEGAEGDQTREMVEGMMDEAVAKELSHRPGLGVAKIMYEQLASQTAEKNGAKKP